MMTQIASITIEDDLNIQSHAAIEVILTLASGEKRWCFFFSPEGASNCGDWIEGTKVPFHYGSPHMILIGTTLTEVLINKTIRYIESRNEILNCTLPINPTAQQISGGNSA